MSETLVDEDLVKYAQQGHIEAVNLLYKRYYSPTYRRITIKIPVEDVDDVTQEVFIAMSKNLGSFRFEAKFNTWMITLTNRKIADYYRNRKNIFVSDSILDESKEKRVKPPIFTKIDDLISLKKAFNTLPGEYQEILLQRFINEYRFNQIAAHFGITLDAAKSRFRRSVAA
ncbi:MAG: sigma-70 family RNA polymerase sigma factor, partial [Anaerolineaceae bacterium]